MTPEQYKKLKPPEYKKKFIGGQQFREYPLADGHSILVLESDVEMIGSNVLIKEGSIAHFDPSYTAMILSMFPSPRYFIESFGPGDGIKVGRR